MHFGEAQHGLVRGCLGSGVCPTSFPALPGIGASGNKSLFSAMGDAISVSGTLLALCEVKHGFCLSFDAICKARSHTILALFF